MQTTLPEWLRWLVGGGAGVITSGLVALLAKWDKFAVLWDRLSAEVKRYAVFVVASLLGWLGFYIQVSIGYIPRPEDPAAWLEALFSIVVSQVVYTGAKMFQRAMRS